MTDVSQPMFLAGERLYLREVRVEDVNERYYYWMNSPEVIRYLESRLFPNSVEGLRQYVAGNQNDPNTLFLAIVLKEKHQHIGNIKLGPIDWIHRRGDVGIMIGEKACWGKGYATETIRVLARHAFNEMNLHKLTASCYAVNPASANAFVKAGFVHEGLRKEHFYCGGDYVDLVVLGMIRPRV